MRKSCNILYIYYIIYYIMELLFIQVVYRITYQACVSKVDPAFSSDF